MEGYAQMEGTEFEETFAPTTKIITIMLALHCPHNLLGASIIWMSKFHSQIGFSKKST
jgi:hypothetical protein